MKAELAMPSNGDNDALLAMDMNDRANAARLSIQRKISSYAATAKCPTCKTTVYDGPDQTLIDGVRYHNWCFRCESCKTKLSAGTGNYRSTNDKNFCHICYDKLFNLAKKQKYSVFGMTEQQQSKLVKSATKESALSWQRESAPSLVSGWADANETPSGKAVLLPNEEALAVTRNGVRSRRGSKSSIGSGTVYGFGSLDVETFGPDGGDGGDNSDRPFDGAAEVDGVEIWRVEGKNVVKKFDEPMADRPVADVGVDAHGGTLYTGDVYIILWSSTRANQKRLAEIYLWIGEESSLSSEVIAKDFGQGLQGHLNLSFGEVKGRRIQQGAEGKYFKKFKGAYANGRTNTTGFNLDYKQGTWASTSKQALIAASTLFRNRLIKVHIADKQVVIEECDKSKSSITEDAVFVLETFGKVYQYNGLKCNPVERHEGRKKLLEVCKNIENSNDGTRTKAIDFEIVMQTVMQTSKGETLFFKVLAGNGPAWKPLTSKQTARTVARSKVEQRKAAQYTGTKWEVKDTTLYEHHTGYFGGRNSKGPGRDKTRFL